MNLVDFKNGELILQQEYDGGTITHTMALSAVRQINPLLEAKGLPNLYHWVGMGLSLQILMRLNLCSFLLNTLEGEPEVLDRAREILNQTSTDLTGETGLGKAICRIYEGVIKAHLSPEEVEEALDFLVPNWEDVQTDMMGLDPDE